jgi:hypothetical protein
MSSNRASAVLRCFQKQEEVFVRFGSSDFRRQENGIRDCLLPIWQRIRERDTWKMPRITKQLELANDVPRDEGSPTRHIQRHGRRLFGSEPPSLGGFNGSNFSVIRNGSALGIRTLLENRYGEFGIKSLMTSDYLIFSRDL